MVRIYIKLKDVWREVVAADLSHKVVVLMDDGVEAVDPEEIEDWKIEPARLTAA